MKARFLLPVVLGLLVAGMPTWAESAAPRVTLTDNSSALASNGSDARSMASVPDFSSGDFSDTLPLFTMHLRRSDLDIGFLAQETVVGPNSLDGAGVMLTFKAGQP